MIVNRRKLLGGGAFLGALGLWQWWATRPAPLVAVPVEGAPGWQFLQAGGVSGLSASDLMTIGLEPAGASPLPAAELEAVVHRDRTEGLDGPVPVAVFSDFFCPYCRVLFSRLANWRGRALAITWHELPLLGPNSMLAGRAAEAAALQGGYVAFYEQLLQDGFRPSPVWLAEVAGRAGLDAARLRRDLEGAAVARRLDQSARAAARLGFYATPGTVIGRLAVLGAIERAAFDDLLERATP